MNQGFVSLGLGFQKEQAANKRNRAASLYKLGQALQLGQNERDRAEYQTQSLAQVKAWHDAEVERQLAADKDRNDYNALREKGLGDRADKQLDFRKYGIDQNNLTREDIAKMGASGRLYTGLGKMGDYLSTNPDAAPSFKNYFASVTGQQAPQTFAPSATDQASIAQRKAAAANATTRASVVKPEFDEKVRHDKADESLGVGRIQIGTGGLAERTRHDQAAESQGSQRISIAQEKAATVHSAKDQIAAINARLTKLGTKAKVGSDLYGNPVYGAPLKDTQDGKMEYEHLVHQRTHLLKEGSTPVNPRNGGYQIVPGVGRAFVTPAGKGPLPSKWPPMTMKQGAQPHRPSRKQPATLDYSKMPTKKLLGLLMRKVK